MSTIRENLIAARALIDTPEKWRKGQQGGAYCLGTALGEACTRVEFEKVRAAVVRHLPSPVARRLAIVAFNDDPNTTHADILALIDRAVADQESQP